MPLCLGQVMMHLSLTVLLGCSMCIPSFRQQMGSYFECMGVTAGEPEYGAVTYSSLVRQFSLMGWSAFGGTNGCIALLEQVRFLPVRWYEHLMPSLLVLATCQSSLMRMAAVLLAP